MYRAVRALLGRDEKIRVAKIADGFQVVPGEALAGLSIGGRLETE